MEGVRERKKGRKTMTRCGGEGCRLLGHPKCVMSAREGSRVIEFPCGVCYCRG